ncbi:MAG TPA: diacylglycerol kinase family protein [Candidatus Dormibacteraeota bacterium]|nr:diacylglycerol kinase family protein [Candidatus Dormibacteraeota bacterium]
MPKADRLLIISHGAGAVNDEVEARLRHEFPDHLVIDFNPRRNFERLITPRARIVVAGGDGTVENVVRKLIDSKHPLGIIPLGSFNNFALALGLPVGLDRAIKVVKEGRPRAITLGRVNKKVFLEACAVGLFGEAIVLGDSAKDLHFGDVVTKLRQVIEAKPFEYELTGDLRGKGTAMSLVFANTSSVGSQLPVSGAKPLQPYLELSIDAGQSHADIVARMLASALLARHEEGPGRIFRFKKVHVSTRPRVRIYADNQPAGRTPATVTAHVSALKVILPR